MVDKLGDAYNFPKKEVEKSLRDLNKGHLELPVLPLPKFSLSKVGRTWKRIYKFLKKDSWASLFVTLVLAIIVIKFLFFPTLSFLTGTPLPLVIVESCSMHHYENGFEKIFEASDVYADDGISLSDSGDWIFQDGFNKGDVIFVVGAGDIEIGDVIVFNGGSTYPIIHRVVEVGDYYATKGDNYKTNSNQLSSEKMIGGEQVVGKALFRVPFVGWIKLIFFEFGRDVRARGFCS
ncbi:MAG: hypothetical protein V1889_00860 [archaeon]